MGLRRRNAHGSNRAFEALEPLELGYELTIEEKPVFAESLFGRGAGAGHGRSW